MLLERETAAGLEPDPEVDAFAKVIYSAPAPLAHIHPLIMAPTDVSSRKCELARTAGRCLAERTQDLYPSWHDTAEPAPMPAYTAPEAHSAGTQHQC